MPVGCRGRRRRRPRRPRLPPRRPSTALVESGRGSQDRTLATSFSRCPLSGGPGMGRSAGPPLSSFGCVLASTPTFPKKKTAARRCMPRLAPVRGLGVFQAVAGGSLWQNARLAVGGLLPGLLPVSPLSLSGCCPPPPLARWLVPPAPLAHKEMGPTAWV